MSPVVEITQSGRGGSIRYREGDREIPFDWEFAMSPAIALIFGPAAGSWDVSHPWAAGRRAEVYAFVGGEVARQKAEGAEADVDLDRGIITIQRAGGATVPLDALGTQATVDAIEAIDQRNDVREPEPHAPGDEPFDEATLALAIRRLHRPNDPSTRALRAAESHDSEVIRQALLWASYNATDCASSCAALLLRLVGIQAGEPEAALLARLGLHNSAFDRQAAFDTLCAHVGMQLDPDVAY
jgi:hypothetical protein